jgi:hypothetical protein
MKFIAPIEDWRSAWKFASVQIAVIGAALMVIADNATSIWASIPPEVAVLIPHSPQIATGIFVLGAIGRVFKLKEKAKYGDPL